MNKKPEVVENRDVTVTNDSLLFDNIQSPRERYFPETIQKCNF